MKHIARLKNTFSNTKKMVVLMLVGLLLATFVTQYVNAEKEKHLYIFPTNVLMDDEEFAWMNIDHALRQDLSFDARFSDFGEGNSASISFGDLFTATSTEDVPSVIDSTTTIPTPVSEVELSPVSPMESATEQNTAPREDANDSNTTAEVSPISPEVVPTQGITPTNELVTPEAAPTPESTSTVSLSDVMNSLALDLPRFVRTASAHDDASSTIHQHDDDQYAVCRTLGIKCHILEFAGFGMIGEVTEQPFVEAKLQVSFASKGGVGIGANDRIVVRAYVNGKWEQLETVELGGEQSNRSRGGYLTVPLTSVSAWETLAATKIAVEYVRETESDAQVQLDGAWIDVTYQDVLPASISAEQGNVQLSLSAADEEARRIERDRLIVDENKVVQFAHADNVEGQTLLLKVDRASYHPLEKDVIYANITNISDSPEEAHLQFHFPESGGEIAKIERWSHNIPFRLSQVKYDTVGYFCASTWQPASSTPSSDGASTTMLYQCLDSSETRQCDSLNEDASNCLSLNNNVGLEEEVTYREGWSLESLKQGTYTNDQGILTGLIQKMLTDKPDTAIPEAVVPAQYLDGSFALEPGQTVYFRMELKTPLNSRGTMFVEVAGESGKFGLKKVDWNASWNAKKTVAIDTYQASQQQLVVPIDLARSGDDFWRGVATSGEDVRFVDPTYSRELPFSITGWDHAQNQGIAWVRIDRNEKATTSIDLYYGDHEAVRESDPALPMRTDSLTPRYVVFGDSSQKDQTLLLIALDDQVRVQVGTREEVELMKGEQFIVTDVSNGETVYANAALTGVVHSIGGGAALVPVSFAGEHFIIPKLGEDSLVALANTDENTDVDVETGVGSSTLGVVFGSVVSAPLASEGAVALISSSPVLGSIISPKMIQTPIYPSVRADLYGIKNGETKIATSESVSAFNVRCENGAIQKVDGRLALSTTQENVCIEGDVNATEAIRIEPISSAIGTHAFGIESSGPVTYLPKVEMSDAYLLPTDTKVLTAVCPAGSTANIGVLSEKGEVIAEGVCEGRGSNPGKLVFDAREGRFRSGESVRTLSATSSAFMLYASIDATPGSEWNVRQLNLWAIEHSRGATIHEPVIIMEKEEFVIPGEHRGLDVTETGDERPHVNKLLLNKREFSQRERPTFSFKYQPQTSGIMQGVRSALGVSPFKVSKVTLVHTTLGLMSDIPMSVEYGEDDNWKVAFDGDSSLMRPGKYLLQIEIEEGGEVYYDAFDFYWGLIAVNYQYSEFVPNDDVRVMLGVLSNTGNTICDAYVKGWVTDPSGVEQELNIKQSGKCNGNNVVDVPDYEATYRATSTGTYNVKVVRLDIDGNLQSQVEDSFNVVERVPYIIERIGPTRVYPLAHYPMKIRVRALEDFSGKIVDRVPGDFIFIDRGNADLERVDDVITATWGANLKKGDVVDYTYVFDSPDISPYLYLLGPVEMVADEGESYKEARQWQIASDAAGKMLIYWDSTSRIPTGWTCVSCSHAATFFRRFAIGSSTYGLTGGTATSSPMASSTVDATLDAGVGPATTNNRTNTALTHSHTLDPQISRFQNYPAYYELLVLQSTSAGEPASIPTGAIVPFDVASSSLPTNWYRYAEMDGRYPMGASSTRITGGTNTHSHVATGTLTAPPDLGLRQNGANNSSATNVHTHTLSATNTDVLSNEPPYVEVLYARLTATSSVSNYMITMWDDTPPAEWQVLSSTSTVFENNFLKASTTYGGTGGALTHAHRDMTNATTSGPSATLTYGTNTNSQGSGTHTHMVSITGFTTESNIPPYVSVIYAKRLSGISAYTQQDYRFYANTNAQLPTDPWPVGGNDLDENIPIDSAQFAVNASNVIRLRMNLFVENSTSTVGRDSFKMQYVESLDCAAALNWSNVASTSSSTATWRGYDNSGATNNSTLLSNVLASSTVTGLYVEENNSTGTPVEIGIGEYGEFDWVLQANSVTSGGTYCFRMVQSDGTPLNTYANYPSVIINSSPNATALELPYDNDKNATTTPTLQFVATDNEGDDIDYQVQVSTSNTFGTTVFDKDSLNDPDLFVNVNNSSNKAPFSTGDSIEIDVSPALTNGSTYWWRARAKDTNGSNSWGSWSSARSFTIDTSVTVSTWFQTTKEQFQTATAVGVESTTTDQAMLTTGVTLGHLYSPAIEFDNHTIGTVWGNLRFADDRTNGTMRYYIEYQDATSGWALIPNADLPSNSTGFSSSPVSLFSINPDDYPTIRIRASFTDSFGTPKLNDWTIEWGYNVETPAMHVPFDNQIVASTSPYLEFTTSDPQSDNLVYQVSWSTTNTFVSSTTRTSDVDSGFRNISSTTDSSPFTSGDRIRYVFQPSENLTASTTYFWRVRAKDPSPGADNYSFWSEVYSFTPGTWARTGIWYQTVDGQFTTDTLTSLETYGANRVRVATSTREAMVAYGEGTTQTPKYRIWDGFNWNAESDALSVGAQIYWTVLRASPLSGVYALGTLGTDKDVNVQLYDDGAWGNKQKISVNVSNYNRRGFDIAYEQVSGRLMAVACDGDPDPSYMTWDGTSWSATGTINISSTLNCEWIRLAAKPNDNEIILLERNTGSRYEAQVWNATTSTWGDVTTLGSMTEFAHEGMAVEYENSGQQGMIVTSNANANNVASKRWDGTIWSATTTTAVTDDLEWANLTRGVATDTMVLCYTNNANSQMALRWDGNAWLGSQTLTTAGAGASKNNNRTIDCEYETTTGRTNNILAAYSTTTEAGSRNYIYTTRTWNAAGKVPTSTTPITVSSVVQTERTRDGKILAMFLSTSTNRYDFSVFSSSTWSALQTLETSASVTSMPYAEPFYMAAKNPAVEGSIISTQANFDDGQAPGWKRFYWTDSKPGGSTLLYQLQYLNASGTWALVPDTDLAGNSSGFSTGPVSINTLDPTTYESLRMRAEATCSLGICPYLDDWTIEWAQGVTIYGTAKERDLITATTSGTVAVAVNGTIQSGKTGSIAANGQWQIDNVTMFSGDVVTVFIQNAASSSRAVAIAKYVNAGDFGGFSLNTNWVTIGSASSTGQTMSLSDISQYDNSISASNDLFYDVTAGGDMNTCVSALASECSNAGIYILSGTTFRPNSSAAKTVNTYDLRIAGALKGDGNTIKVGGDWRNLGGFDAHTSTVIFNATSTSRTIDQTGGATTTFYNVTFGETGNTGLWSFTTAFTATGTTQINFGTLSPGAGSMTLQGDLTIGASGTFTKGNATTTFSGATSKVWTDNTAAKQDLGNVNIDGTAKTLTLGSSVKMTNLTIGADDTFDATGGNTITVIGNWVNNNTFTPRTSTVTMTATTTGTINVGSSSFYNLTFSGASNGVPGVFSFNGANATATNNFTIATGTVVMPTGTLAVGGNFDNSGGEFTSGTGIIRLNSTASGKTIRSNNSNFYELQIAGSGGTWSFTDTNATTTASTTIVTGALTLPTGTLAVGGSFVNTGGSFAAGTGILRMTAVSGVHSLRTNGSSLANLQIAGAGTFRFPENNATTTQDVSINQGVLVFPYINFGILGSFRNVATFDAATSTTIFAASSGSKTIAPGSSSFNNLTINGAGTFTITENATSSGAFTINNAGAFTVNSGVTLGVGGTFTNLLGGSATTWTGSTLFLNSGTSFTINTKNTGGDVYATIKSGTSTQPRMWASSAATYTMSTSGSLYSQNHASTSGALNIYGNYTKTSGTDYWSYSTDFDGTALTGGSQRQVSVLFGPYATSTYIGSQLQILGGGTATTTIDRESAGSYHVEVNGGTINAQYYQFRNLAQYGLELLASTTITSLRDGDFELSQNGSSMMTIASTTIDTNPAAQIFAIKFATSTGITSGYNVTELGTASSYIRFRQHSGNYDGESFDNDPTGNPGFIRWDDSNFTINISGNVYSDDGVTGMTSPTCDGSTSVVRVKVDGAGSFAAPCTSGSGAFTVTGVSFTGDTVMSVYLDTNGGDRAVTVTRSAVTDISGLALYKNRVIVRHEDTQPITIANLNQYDNADDTDIPYSATLGAPDTLVVKPDTELWVWTGKTFVPGGNVTTQSGGTGNNWDGSLRIAPSATFTSTGSESHSIGGRLFVNNGATLSTASTLFTFTATTTGKSIAASSTLTFNDITFNGVGGNWSIDQNVVVSGTLSPQAGTISGASNITVSGTNVTGGGIFAMTGGTFTLSNGGTFGSSQDWSFAGLTFSGTNATTTRTGSSTVTVSGVLTISSSHALQAGTSTAWVLTGAGTPLVASGTFVRENSVVRYAGTSAQNIAALPYYRLTLAPSSGSPTYTFAAGNVSVLSMLALGNGTDAVTVNANTNDPAITLFDDLRINTNATFIASNSGAFTVAKNWVNSGTFTSSSGSVTLNGTTTGLTVNPGNSSFGTLIVSGATGGWTIPVNATTTGAFSLSSVQSFTLGAGATLAVGGVFTNSVGGTATTWDGSVLYLYSGTAYDLNTKTVGDDEYETLNIGANTAIAMWNSVATTTLTSTGASMYSKDHSGVDGALYIWGTVTRSTGGDYWGYLTDFDGVALSTSTARAVDVRFATGATYTLSGTGQLEIMGSSTATTTLDRQSSGNYAFNISGGSTTVQFASFRNTDTNGVNISGTAVINAINDSDFELGINSGSLITVAGATIDANPLKTFYRNRFATSTGITGNNVRATGSTGFAWRFNLSHGNLNGEAYDSDPGGDPGYLIWDDSAANITISGRVFSDEGKTYIGAGVCNGITQVVRLKIQGAGTYTSACDGSGDFSISNVIFNPGDTMTLYLDSGGGASAANISIDPSTNIANMHLYQDRVIVRHEDTAAITIAKMIPYDSDQDSDIPFNANVGSPNTLTLRSGTGLVIWDSKTFTPGGNVILNANASGNWWDGTLHLNPNARMTDTANTHTIGGQFLADSGASVTLGTSLVNFIASTSARLVVASSTQTFGAVTFNGTGGTWDISGIGTTTGVFTISTGAVTLPSATISLGNSFVNSGGSFDANGGTIAFVASTTGRTISASGSSFNNIDVLGTGGSWTMTDANATSTGSVNIYRGTLNLPGGTFAVRGDFANQGGVFTGGSGTVKLTKADGNTTVRTGGSSFNNLYFAGTSTYAIPENYATTTGDVLLLGGTTTFPYVTFAVGGSLTNTAVFTSATSTLLMSATTGTKTLDPGASLLYDLVVSGAGNFQIAGNATATNNFTINNAGTFTANSGVAIGVGGTFTNRVGGVSTTWTGSTLSLYSGGNYSINTKTLGGDAYGTLRVSSTTQIRSWDSSATTVSTDANSSYYSQDHGGSSGALNIYGNYSKSIGTDYWSYATDFDGTALGGSSRLVNVRIGPGATTTYQTGATLQVIGGATATTSIDRISTGGYAVAVDGAFLNASYYQFRNLGQYGLQLIGTTTITLMNNGDFELAQDGNSLITIASTTIDQNASSQIFTVNFATSSGVTSGANVTRVGNTSSAITFQQTYGNFDGENYDSDGVDGCGSIRWDDSACLFVDQNHYRWRDDDGGEGVPSSEWYSSSWSKRKRVTITNSGTSTLTNAQIRLNVAYDADMQSNFNDIRFTSADGTTLIDHWIQEYVNSASSTVWVEVPSIAASGVTDIFMYYGNGTANSGSSGTTTFTFFDDFEDNNLTEYSGDTSLYENSTTYNYERTYGLAASAGNTAAQNTSGIAQVSAGIGRGTTFRYYQYVNTASPANDEACFLFGVANPITAHQNYGICFELPGQDKVAISKNVAYNYRNGGATELATTSVTWATGWYQTTVDWLNSGRIDVTVRDSIGAIFATTSYTDTTYSSGGVGFTFWGQRGGWDIPTAGLYYAVQPTATFGLEQVNSGASWLALQDTALLNQPINENVRLRFTIKNSGTAITGQNYRLQFAPKLTAPNCESVASGNYSDMPTTSGGCGSSAACLTGTSQFVNNASTTQLLSVPAGFTFTEGQAIEDPSAQTGNLSLDTNTVTEVEYNFQMTSYANQAAYCFRTTNGVTPLDNYSKVPELDPLYVPSISDWTFNNNSSIALTEGTGTIIYATGTVSDLNGYTDIVAASSTFFRSGVTGARSCTADQNDCYQIATTSCLLTNCSGNSCTISCTANMQYFADPTDAGSTFASQIWDAFLDIWDSSGSHSTASSTQELYSMKALAIPASINYGSVTVGGDTGSSNASTSVNNTGNTLLNLLLSGTDLTSGSSTIAVNYQKYATSTFTYTSCVICNALSSSTQSFDLNVSKPTSTSAFYQDILWGLQVPGGTAATTHNGVNTFIAN